MVSRAPDAKGLRIRRWPQVRERVFAYYRVTHPLSDRVVQPFDTSLVNVVSGMKERVFFIDETGARRPPCIREHSECRRLVEKVVGMVGVCNRVSGRAFIAARSGSKQKAYLHALRRLGEVPMTLSKLAELSYFVKTESTQHLKRQVPRIISPRSYGFNYLLGRYTMAVEHKIFDGLCSLFDTPEPVVAKGLTQQRKGQIIAAKLKPGYVCVGLDASRFDQTIGEELLKLEHSLVKGIFHGDRLLANLLACQLNNRGRSITPEGIVKANIGAMRCSGDQNTSLGNCIISCVLAAKYFEENGVTGGDIFNDGDDLLMFVPKSQFKKLTNLSAWYLNWGLRMKVEEPAFIPEQVEFCQSKVVFGPDGWMLVRDFRKVLNCDYAHNGTVNTHDKFRAHLRSVGLCGLSMAAGIPVLQEYYALGVRQGLTGKELCDMGNKIYQRKIQINAGHHPKEREISAMTRISFSLAFGLTPYDQMAYEDMISTWTLAAQPVILRQDLQTSKYV